MMVLCDSESGTLDFLAVRQAAVEVGSSLGLPPTYQGLRIPALSLVLLPLTLLSCPLSPISRDTRALFPISCAWKIS